MKNPMVSVAMITYGHEKYIEDAINGVLMQVCDFEIELIISNDCSPDNTDEVIQKIINNHPKSNRIKYINHKQNLGMMPNFVYVMNLCKGKYIALCEGDDYWTDHLKLQKQIDFLENNLDFSYTFHDCEIYNQENKTKSLLIGTKKVDNVVNLKSIVIEKNCPTLSLVFRNKIKWNLLPNWFITTENGDYALIVFLAEIGLGKYFSDVMGVYRFHNQGVWSGSGLDFFNKTNLKLSLNLYNYFENNEIQKILKTKIKYFKVNIAINKLREGHLFSGYALLLPNVNFVGNIKFRTDLKKILSATKMCLKQIKKK